MSCRRLVFDTGPRCSFAVVARLDLLEAALLRVRLAGWWLGGNADGASVGGAVWTSGPPLGGGRSRGSKG